MEPQALVTSSVPQAREPSERNDCASSTMEGSDRVFWFRGTTVELVDRREEGEDPALCVGNVTLTAVSARRWTVEQPLIIPEKATRVLLVISSDEEGDIGFVCWDLIELAGRWESSPCDVTRQIEGSDSQLQFTLSSKFHIIPTAAFDDFLLDLQASAVEEIRDAWLAVRNGSRGPRSVAEISKAITTLGQMVSAAGADDDDVTTGRLILLGGHLQERYHQSRSPQDIKRAVEAIKKAMSRSSNSDDHLTTCLVLLPECMSNRFWCTGSISDLSEAISLWRQKLTQLPERFQSIPESLYSIGILLLRRSEKVQVSPGENDDLTESVTTLKKCVALTPEGDKHLANRLHALSHAMSSLFRIRGDASVLSELISFQTRCADLTPDGHVDLPERLTLLALSLSDRFNLIGSLSDVDNAISHLQRAIKMGGKDGRSLAGKLFLLADSLACRFKRTSDSTDLRDMIVLGNQARRHVPDGDQGLADLVEGRVWITMSKVFDPKAGLAHATEAISALNEILHSTPEDDGWSCSLLHFLGIALQCRFQETGDPTDLLECIAVRRIAVDRTPISHFNAHAARANLATSLHSLFIRDGEIEVLSEAIAVQKHAVGLLAEGHGDLPLHLHTLGSLLSGRFQHTGEISELTEAISLQREAVHLAPEGHGHLPVMLQNLGNSLEFRYGLSMDPADIAAAVSARSKAVHLAGEGEPALREMLQYLGNTFRMSFMRTRDPLDLARSIEHARKSIELTPSGHPDLWLRLHALAMSLGTQAVEDGSDPSALQEAISVCRRAVDLAPKDDIRLYALVGHLASQLFELYKRTMSMCHLDESVMMYRRCLRLLPEGHAGLCGVLGSGGNAVALRFSVNGDPEDLRECVSYYKAAASGNTGRVRDRMTAARSWARHLVLHDPATSEVLTAYECAVNALALEAGLRCTAQRRHTLLETSSGLTLEAAAAALHFKQLGRALEWLEQGRCLMWSQQNQLRTPLDELRIHNASLADNLLGSAAKLETAGGFVWTPSVSAPTSKGISLKDEAGEHERLVVEWEGLVSGVRSIPGFEGFLQPPSYSSIKENLPESGIVVVINVDNRRCDAIALFEGLVEPLHTPLPEFSLEKAQSYRAALDTHLRSQGLRSHDSIATPSQTQSSEGCASLGDLKESDLGEAGVERALGVYRREDVGIHDILRSLWFEVVRPILNALEIKKVDVARKEAVLPRIWWCLTGPLTFLPIHAAGDYGVSVSEGLYDYAVSSYIPTIASLTQRVKLDRPISSGVRGIFLTNQPSPPGAGGIPGTTKEIELIQAQARAQGIRVKSSEGGAVSPEECLDRMEEYSCIHLACHGSQDKHDPLQSRFLFHKGRLTLRQISQRNLKQADLAFLSACQTSTGEQSLSDEAVHLAGGMLAAGYRRVVATMWSIEDKHAPRVAEDFYQYLWGHREGSGNIFDGSKSAYALHHAIQRLRKRFSDSKVPQKSDTSLLAWIPYVHYGY